MKKKSIALGIVLILLAVYLVVSRLGFAPALPFFTIVFTLILAYTTIKGFVKLHFTEAFLSLAILGCIHDELLHIEALTPWTLLLVGLLLGIAFDMMFKGVRSRRKNKDRGMFMEWDSDNGGHIEWESDLKVEDIPDGETVHVENTFGSKSKYVNSDAFSKAHIENSFGILTMRFLPETMRRFVRRTALVRRICICRVPGAYGNVRSLRLEPSTFMEEMMLRRGHRWWISCWSAVLEN